MGFVSKQMAKTKYSEEVRAQCVAAMLEGQGFPIVSKEYSVPQSTLQYWKKKAAGQLPTGAREQRESRIANLIGDYLEASLETLRTQAIAFRDTDWLREQSAAEVGVLHGVLLDKAVRILNAAERAGNLADEPEADGGNVVSIARTANGRARK
jgi:transposase-like protein